MNYTDHNQTDRFTQDSCDKQNTYQSFLQHYSLLPPPNPIISKSLQIQQAPKIRLMQPILNSTMPQKIKPKISWLQVNPQKDAFSYLQQVLNITDNDSLIYYYLQKRTQCKLVYLKYNNIKFLTLNQHIKYLAGNFICNKQSLEINNLPHIKINLIPDQLIFDSRFESGNLFCAIRIAQYQYDLVLQNDVNSKGNTQWFYFSIKNCTKGVSYKFNIVNLVKSSSLFQQGLQPACYSSVQKKWLRKGSNISYREGACYRQGCYDHYYQLSFSYKIMHSNQVLYFAHSYPYPLYKLQSFLNHIQKHKIFTKQEIARSPLNHQIPLISIKKTLKKNAILIMARQHPGQTPASFVMEGIINYLCQKQVIPQQLIKKFNFFIFPMVNPDGVVCGNYRSNVFGFDLNRKWKYPSKKVHSQICSIKRCIEQISKKFSIKMVIDLHGHSKKLNSFFYGNLKDNEYCKGYPYLCSKINSHISFQDSYFGINEQKRCTARVHLYQRLGIPMIYTFQTSFYGYEKDAQIYHFTISDLKRLGRDLLIGIYEIQQCDIKELKIQSKDILKQDHGSESQPSVDQLKQEDILCQFGNFKKKEKKKKIESCQGIVRNKGTQTDEIKQINSVLKRIQSAGLMVTSLCFSFDSKEYVKTKRASLINLEQKQVQTNYNSANYIHPLDIYKNNSEIFIQPLLSSKSETALRIPNHTNTLHTNLIQTLKKKVLEFRSKSPDQKQTISIKNSIQPFRRIKQKSSSKHYISSNIFSTKYLRNSSIGLSRHKKVLKIGKKDN